MGFLGNYNLNDTITFSVNTHSTGTGAAVDADFVPTYRVYETNISTPVLTGSMSLLDSSNTVGFYIASFVLSGETFSNNKHYTIYISSTVSGIVGTSSHQFQLGSFDMIEVINYVDSVDMVEGSVDGGLLSDTYSSGGDTLDLIDTLGTLTASFYFPVNLDDNLISFVISATSNVGTVTVSIGAETVSFTENETKTIYLDRTTSLYGTSPDYSLEVEVASETEAAFNIDYMHLNVVRPYNSFIDKPMSEIGQLNAVSTTASNKINYLYKSWRNKIVQSVSNYRLYNDDTSTVDQKLSISDNQTTFTRDKIVSGP